MRRFPKNSVTLVDSADRDGDGDGNATAFAAENPYLDLIWSVRADALDPCQQAL
jgi:hypothetical protein